MELFWIKNKHKLNFLHGFGLLINLFDCWKSIWLNDVKTNIKKLYKK